MTAQERLAEVLRRCAVGAEKLGSVLYAGAAHLDPPGVALYECQDCGGFAYGEVDMSRHRCVTYPPALELVEQVDITQSDDLEVVCVPHLGQDPEDCTAHAHIPGAPR